MRVYTLSARDQRGTGLGPVHHVSKDVLEKCKKGSYFWSRGAERLVAQTALSHFVHRVVWRSPRIAIRISVGIVRDMTRAPTRFSSQ